MALFAVTRYMCDDEEETDKSKQTETLLQKLQHEAKQRKKQRKSLTDDKIETNINKPKAIQGKNLNKTENFSESLSFNLNEKSLKQDISSDKKKRNKRKRKLSNCSDSNTSDSAVCLESNNEETALNDEDIHIDTALVSQNADKSKRKKKKKGADSGSNSKDKHTSSKSNDNLKLEDTEHDEVQEEENEDDENDKDDDNEPLVLQEGPNEINGYTVLGDMHPRKLEKVKRVLPSWLSKPHVIGTSLKDDKLPVTEMPGLDTDLVEKLKKNNITNFFPVQMHVIPILLEPVLRGFHTGKAGYRPSDVCVSAPTGSGKTLAFVIPVVQALRKRVCCHVRALAVLPVRDLAVQVYKVFQTYCQGTPLKVGLIVGQKTFDQEQQMLLRHRLNGVQSQVDIVVATPGRLVDHINKTPGFNLNKLRFLVIDEADRMMDEIKQDWLPLVEKSVYSGGRQRPGPLTAASCLKYDLPLQKLLYSATLSQNPEKLQQLNLFQPKLFTSVVKETVARETNNTKTNQGDVLSDPETGQGYVGKYATPAELTEYRVEVKAANKPLVILHLLINLGFKQVLCFTNSVEATHRLYWLIRLIGGIKVQEFSSNLSTNERQKIISSFEAGKLDILICSDAMARGIDLENVKYVISYDPPSYIKTYIHRIGRTARAGKCGSAITLLQKSEFKFFKSMLREAGKENLQKMNVSPATLEPLVPRFKDALMQLETILQKEKKKDRFES